jgi:hypothetical protein
MSSLFRSAATNPTGLLVILSGLLLALFLSSFPLLFGIHNDYSAWSWPFNETKFLFAIGRPVQAILLNLQFWPLHTVADFSWARMASALFAAAGFLLTQHVLRTTSNWRIAILASFLIWTLPPSLLYVLWLTNFVPGTLTAILATFSYYIVNYSFKAGGRLTSRCIRASGYTLLFVCFCSYPPTAYFFLVFTAWRALFWTDKRVMQRIMGELVGVAILSVAYFVFLKVGNKPAMMLVYGPDIGPAPQGNYKIALSADWGARASILQSYLRKVLVLWFAPFGQAPILGICSILFFGFGTRICRAPDRRDVINRILCVVACFLMSIGPVVLSNTTEVETRSLFSSEAILVVVFVGAGDAILNTLRVRPLTEAIAVCCVGIVAALGILTVHAVALNANSEYEYLRKSLAKTTHDSSGVLILMPPQMDKIVDSPFIYDNFGLLATNSFPVAGIVYMILLNDYGLTPDSIRPAFVSWESQVSIENLPARFAVIDMAQAGFQRAAHESGYRRRLVRQVSVSKLNGIGENNWTISAAFDKSPLLGGWESTAGLPIDVTIRQEGDCFDLSGYSLRADLYAPLRMPRAWQVLGKSANGSEFRVLDTHSDAPLWHEGEERHYPLLDSGCIAALRFHFSETGDNDILRIWKIDLEQRPPSPK